MALLATPANFAAWYSAPGAYPFYAERAAWVNAEVPTGKLLVVGAGWGYLVSILANAYGRDVWGIDAETTMVAASVAGNRLRRADATVRADLNATRTAAGIAANGRFAAGITEDVLPCLSVAEVATALGELRRVTSRLLHIVTPGDGTPSPPGRFVGMTWRTLAEWKQLVGADTVKSAEGGSVL